MNKQTSPMTPVAAATINTASNTAVKTAPATTGQQRLWYQCETLQPPYSYNEHLEVMVY